MYKIAVAVCFMPITAFAQYYTLQAGASIPVYLKCNAAPEAKNKFPAAWATGAELALQVNGARENAMSLLQIAGIKADIRSFSAEPGSQIKTSLFFVDINPNVLISSKWKGIKYSLGIGAMLNIGEGVEVSTSSASSGTFYSNVDTIAQKIDLYSRRVIPFIALGIIYDVNKHLRAEIKAEPTLINFYEPGAALAYKVNYDIRYFALSYQPAYFGVKVLYLF